MVIESQLTLKEYRNFCYAYLYAHPFYRVITLLGIVMMFVLVFDAPDDTIIFSIQIISVIIILVVIPLRVFRNSEERFKESNLLNEKIIYEFTDEKVSVKGESFNSEYQWGRVSKMKQLKNWIVIFVGKRTGFIISKEALGGNLDEFKGLVRGKIREQKLKKSTK